MVNLSKSSTPGVYLEEIKRGPRPIAGVPTSIAAFLGETERGPVRPHLISSYAEYKQWFGSVFSDRRYMPDAVNGFFENGGKRLFVCRIVGDEATAASQTFGDITVKAIGSGAWGRRIWVKFENGSIRDGEADNGFRMKLAYWSTLPEGFVPYDPFDPNERESLPRPQFVEDHDNLSVDLNSTNHFSKRLGDSVTSQPVSRLVFLDANLSTPVKPQPGFGGFLDQDGDDDSNPLGADDFQGHQDGNRTQKQGLQALELDPYREVSLIYAPHPSDNHAEIAKAIIDHCERLRFRFAVIDGSEDTEPATLDPRTTNGWNTSYAAFYAPWVVVTDPESGACRNVPPGGFVFGVYARTDSERGVFKAPANEIVRGVSNVRFDINNNIQEILNPKGVNAIRVFPARGIRVWGARTLSSDSLWKYVSVRRLFIFLERSIYEGIQWVVFEPNDERLWASVKDTIRVFLNSQWRAGALVGRTEEEAFFITCDRTTMTQDDIDNGRLICEIGIATVRPAEFINLRIFQKTAEAQC